MCNFAPPDMVGHTGKYEPAIKGCEATGESTVLYNQLQHYDGYAFEICQDEKASVFFLDTDKAIGEIAKACEETGYVLMITADHGNAEQMMSEKGGPHTAHTTNRG